MTTTDTLRVGDRVTVVTDPGKFPGVWTVVKVNPRTVSLDQSGRRLRADVGCVAKVDGATLATATTVPIPEYLAEGTVVTVRGREGYWVVIKSAGDKTNVAKLGGDGGRYLRCSTAGLVRSDVLDGLL